VLTTDPYVNTDPSLVPFSTVVEDADLLVIGAPHRRYAKLPTDKPVIDIWGLCGKGVRV
jgi:UDP-N-acetyl-D-mannosaminuronic acid dehydrogenase